MKIAITGHIDIERCFNIREESNYYYNKEVYDTVYKEILRYLHDFAIKNKIPFSNLTLISGMARGVDEIFAQIAINHNLNLIISVPKSIEFHKNKIVDNLKIQALNYDNILQYSKLTIYKVDNNLNQGNYGYFLARNQKMVDLADYVISYQKYDSTGTQDCIDRAIKENKYIGNI